MFTAGAEPEAANKFGKTPLMYACDYSEVEVAAVLLEHGEQLFPDMFLLMSMNKKYLEL